MGILQRTARVIAAEADDRIAGAAIGNRQRVLANQDALPARALKPQAIDIQQLLIYFCSADYY